MRRALEYASMFKMPVIDHCEDPSLKGDGVAHEGAAAGLLGLRGIPGVAERQDQFGYTLAIADFGRHIGDLTLPYAQIEHYWGF